MANATVHCTCNLERTFFGVSARRANYNATRMLSAVPFPRERKGGLGGPIFRVILRFDSYVTRVYRTPLRVLREFFFPRLSIARYYRDVVMYRHSFRTLYQLFPRFIVDHRDLARDKTIRNEVEYFVTCVYVRPPA